MFRTSKLRYRSHWRIYFTSLDYRATCLVPERFPRNGGEFVHSEKKEAHFEFREDGSKIPLAEESVLQSVTTMRHRFVLK